jgi:hypothetical protein
LSELRGGGRHVRGPCRLGMARAGPREAARRRSWLPA